MRALRTIVVTLGLAVLGVRPAGAQPLPATGSSRGGPLLATRAVLEARVAALQAAGGQSAGAEIALLRRRLAEGDFQTGDRVLLFVQGEAELSDTFTVQPGHELALPVVGTISLYGVLRSELEARLEREIARYVREPTVRAMALVMISVTGDVTRPGFYPLPVNALVADVVMVAGGGTRDAKLKDMRIERGGAVLWNAAFVTRAVAEGRTLDDIALRSGDQFVVPGRARTSTESGLRVVALLLSIPVTAYTLTRIF